MPGGCGGGRVADPNREGTPGPTNPDRDGSGIPWATLTGAAFLPSAITGRLGSAGILPVPGGEEHDGVAGWPLAPLATPKGEGKDVYEICADQSQLEF